MSVMEELRLEDPVLEREELAVAIPKQPWILPLGVVSVALLGGLVFWQLNEARVQADAAVDSERDLSSPEPAPSAPYEMPPLAPPFAEGALLEEPVFDDPASDETMAPPPFVSAHDTEIPLQTRLNSPALVFDQSQAASDGAPSRGGTVPTIGDLARSSDAPNADGSFTTRSGREGPDIERISNQGFTIVEGAVISAVLETAINSDLPGHVRAIVSRDVHSFDGTNVLIPEGSRLVGVYRSSASLGQSRAFVIWTRVIRPDGVSVRLDAPGADTLGRGGLEGKVDRHFLERFGGALLLSLINAGGALAGDDTQTQVVIGSTANAAGNATAQALQSDLSITPTVEVPHGASIRVFVTRDLDFSVLDEAE